LVEEAIKKQLEALEPEKKGKDKGGDKKKKK
jgi:hypothetical protein